jgi:DNA (cytosine-5)-methyltransferase 1
LDAQTARIAHGSLFSGIEGFGTGFTRANPLFETVYTVEIDKHAQRVLKSHYPDAVHYTDVADIDPAALLHADVITFGSPCQDLSVAGKRAGLDGSRSNLFYHAARIIHARDDCQFAIWENVPGALSSNQRADFAAALGALVGCEVTVPAKTWGTFGVVFGPLGQAVWRVMDAQWFGVAQRRRRLFVVVDLRGQRAGEVLSEFHRGGGHPAPRRPTWQNPAARPGDGPAARLG